MAKTSIVKSPKRGTLREGPLMIEAARRYGRVVSGGSQRVLEDYRDLVAKCWGGELGTIKSINVNVGPSHRFAICRPNRSRPISTGSCGSAPRRGLLTIRNAATATFGTSGGSWRSYVDYSGGGMTDWGAHHFGGATFAVDVRELQPVEVIYNDEKGQQFVTLRYPNGLLVHHNYPGRGNLDVEGTPGEASRGEARADL